MKKYTLDNGLTVIVDLIDFFKTFSLGFWVRAGSSYEDKLTNGYTHFLEHMLFKGTKKRSYYEISYEIESLGGYLNAFTGKENTCFYVNLQSTHQDTGINVLWDMVNNSTISLDELEKEKLVVLEEIKATEDSPDDLIYDIFSKEFWKGYSQGYPILGNAENISSINKESIEDFFNCHYKPSNFIISISGSFDANKLLKEIEKLNLSCIPKNKTKQSDYSKLSPSKISFSEYHHNRQGLEQIYVIVGFKAPSRYSEKRFALFLLSNILGEGSSSRLFVALREKQGLCYSVYTFCSLNKDNGVLGIALATSYKKYQKAKQSLLEEITKITMGITVNELTKGKEQLKASIIFSYENLESRMNINAKNLFYYNRFIDIYETIDKIDAVTLDEVNNLSKEILNTHTTVSLGKKI